MTRFLRRESARFKDGISPVRILLAALISIIVVLSAISAFYILQSKDYHDAKYRAQWVLMWDITSQSDNAAGLLSGVTGHYPQMTLEYRALWSAYLTDSLGSLVDSSWALREMYLNDAVKNETFGLLGAAMSQLQQASLQIEMSLVDNITQGVHYTENATLNDSLFNASIVLEALHETFFSSFKVDPNGGTDRSWEASPYSLVDRLDLAKVKSSSQEIMAIADQI